MRLGEFDQVYNVKAKIADFGHVLAQSQVLGIPLYLVSNGRKQL